MTTIINGPTPVQTLEHESSGSRFLIGVLTLIALVVVFVYFGIPVLNRMQSPDVTVSAPEINVEAPKVVIPDKVEIVTAE